jgi:MazG family protein
MSEPMNRLLEIMARLRGPDGCPWDREQTLATLREYLLEESHEVLEALSEDDRDALCEELGDLLFQIVFQSRIAEELGWFDFAGVAEGIAAKLVRRHPHVFGSARLASSQEVIRQWEELKTEEREREGQESRLAGTPRSLPALRRALRISEKAARSGFDWPDIGGVLEKVREELSEWEEAAGHGDRRGRERELGDLLFTLVNAARKMEIDPEAALQATSDRFSRRFHHMEETARRGGESLERMTPARWEELWEEAKRRESGAQRNFD